MMKRLPDDVYPDHLAVCGKQPLGDRARSRIADGTPIDHARRNDPRAGAREEPLVGGVQVVGLEVLYYQGDVHLLGDVENDAARDALEDSPVGGRLEHTVFDEEDVVSDPLGQISIAVEEDRGGVRVDVHRLQLRKNEVGPAVVLDLGVYTVAGVAACLDDHPVSALDEVVREAAERQVKYARNVLRSIIGASLAGLEVLDSEHNVIECSDRAASPRLVCSRMRF
jgi:PAS domain-containing protein